MGITIKSRRFAAWLAILAMAFNALWPLAANAKPSGAFDPSTEICTSSGVKTFAGGKVLPQPAESAHLPDCSFCTLGADELALPAAAVSTALHVPQAADFQAAAAALPPAEPFGYSPAHPRAPPVFS
jgi:hypothetical protein